LTSSLGTPVAAPITGGCLCGSVRYTVTGPLRDIVACHCEQCRRSSGHFVAATACRKKYFTLDKQDTLRWFSAVPGFRRGFCNACGSSLFFEEEGGERMSIAAGSLDNPQGLRIAAHIFTAEAGDYYTIDKNVARSADHAHEVKLP
jgi:adhesin HecA-like repeat protein